MANSISKTGSLFMASPGSLAKPSPTLCDNIDVETRDFASLTEGVHPIDGQVIVALTIHRGSGASVQDDGNDIYKIRKMADDAERRAEGAVRRALKRLVDGGDITLKEVSVPYWNEGAQTGEVYVAWINNRDRSQERKSTTAAISPPLGV